MKTFLRSSVLALVVFFCAGFARADWTVNGNPVSTAEDLQMNPVIVSYGAGVFVVWQDRRNGTDFDIYAQKVDALGNVLWAADGVPVCTEAGDQTDPRVIYNIPFSIIVVWEDARSATNFDIYAQRIDTDGNPMWETNGVALCALDFNQQNPAIASGFDGALAGSGAIVTWQDQRTGSTADIYAQSVNADGDTLWPADGVEVCIASRAQITPVIQSDFAGGAIISWVDRRAGLGDIYVQHVDVSGSAQWAANGVALCAADDDQTAPALTTMFPNYGAFVAWADKRSGEWDVYANFIDVTGAVFAANGVPLCTAAGDQQNPAITFVSFAVRSNSSRSICGDAGTSVVAWDDKRTDAGDIYVRDFNCDGLSVMPTDGIALCTAPLAQVKPVIDCEMFNSPVVAWQDQRQNFQTDIYAQQVTFQGTVYWEPNGAKVCVADGYQYDPVLVFMNGVPVATWEDLRSGTYDVYAQQVIGLPNAVAITSFGASARAGVVTLRAAFRSNLSVESVNVYRALGIGELRRIETVAGNFSDGFEYVDESALPGQTYRYQIGVVDADGEFLSAVATVTIAKTSAALHQNRPNPFNPSTTIWYDVPERGYVSLAIFDASGRHIRTLASRIDGAGKHSVLWDGRDDSGVPQSSGVYFYQLRVGNQIESKKMVLLK